MAEPDVIQLPERQVELELPEAIIVTAGGGMRLSANEMRALKAETGRSLTELMGEGADEADQLQSLVWLRLRREGYPHVTWEQAGDVAVDYAADEPDPTSTASSSGSSDSADSGA